MFRRDTTAALFRKFLFALTESNRATGRTTHILESMEDGDYLAVPTMAIGRALKESARVNYGKDIKIVVVESVRDLDAIRQGVHEEFRGMRVSSYNVFLEHTTEECIIDNELRRIDNLLSEFGRKR